MNTFLGRIKWRCFFPFFILMACVERIDFDLPSSASQIIVEGMISDQAGPYTVKVSNAMSLDTDSVYFIPVRKMKVKLYDDEGNTEQLVELNDGTYATEGLIRGKVGHSYHIELQTPDGKTFESESEKINPVGEVESIRYEFEARTADGEFGDARADVFNIYIDADGGTSDENYFRWKYTGTYKVLTNPELRRIWSEGFLLSDPLPCSGYVVAPGLGGGVLDKVAECTCCTCWANQYEAQPLLSDVQFAVNNKYKNVKVAEVPITSATFYDKYLIEVEQMSLTREAFEFFKLVRAQIEGAKSLFQPPSGELKGNIKATNSTDPVVGLFWATSVTSKSIFINRSEVPYNLQPIFFVTDDCTKYYPNASIIKPELWQ